MLHATSSALSASDDGLTAADSRRPESRPLRALFVPAAIGSIEDNTNVVQDIATQNAGFLID